MSINQGIVMEGRVNASENGMNIRVGMCLLVGSVPIYLEKSQTGSKENPVDLLAQNSEVSKFSSFWGWSNDSLTEGAKTT